MRLRHYFVCISTTFVFIFLGVGIASSDAQQADKCVAFPAECEELEAAEYEGQILQLLDAWRLNQLQTEPDEPTRPGCDSLPIRQPGESAEEYFAKLAAWTEQCSSSDDEVPAEDSILDQLLESDEVTKPAVPDSQ